MIGQETGLLIVGLFGENEIHFLRLKLLIKVNLMHFCHDNSILRNCKMSKSVLFLTRRDALIGAYWPVSRGELRVPVFGNFFLEEQKKERFF